MKKLLLILAMVFLVQNMTYADEGKGKGKRFEENKGRVLENLNKKLGFLNDFKGCVTSAISRKHSTRLIPVFTSALQRSRENMKAYA